LGEVCYPQQWFSVAAKIAEQGRVAVIVGGVDSGKTTFAAFLVNYLLNSGLKCAVVDADVGQSSIGPPGTIGVGFPDQLVEELSEIPMDHFYFVGAISPRGNLLPCVVGTKKMVEYALNGLGSQDNGRVIVDTTGLVHGNLGRTLKEYKLDLLRPDHVVFFQRRRELEGLARLWEGKCSVHLLSVSPAVTPKTASLRARRRAENWYRFFEGSSLCEFSFHNIVFSRTFLGSGQPLNKDWKEKISRSLGKEILWMEFSPEQSWLVAEEQLNEEELAWLRAGLGLGRSRISQYQPDYFEGLLVGLIDGRGVARSLGVIKGVDFRQEKIIILSPFRETSEIREIQFGSFHFPSEQKSESRIGEG
jgi:polynucleotide 5'-hydroxyl-kinase GRC3/NOL9